MEFEKSVEVTDEVVDPIQEHEPSYLDVPPKGGLIYIVVIQLVYLDAYI